MRKLDTSVKMKVPAGKVAWPGGSPPSFIAKMGTLPPVGNVTPTLGPKVPPGSPTIVDALKPATDILASRQAAPTDLTSLQATSPTATETQPAASTASATPDEWQGIAPVPVTTFDGKSWLRKAVGIAMTPMPGETADQMSMRVQKMSDFNKKIDLMGPMQPDEAQAIFYSWYDGMVPQQPPVTTSFSPEAQSALDEAYGPVTPRRLIATGQDVDRNKLLAVAAYGIANMLTGKGTFMDGIRSATPLMKDAQASLDTRNQIQDQEDEMRRRRALERFHRISSIEDDQAKQAGYLSHDMRLTQRGEINALMRDASAGAKLDATSQAAVDKIVAKANEDGDPGRIKSLSDYLVSRGYPPLPDSMINAKPTIKQQKTLAEIQKIGDERLRIQALTQKFGFQNEIDAHTFADQINIIQNKAEKGDAEVRKIEFESEHLPLEFRLKLALRNAQTAATIARGKAAEKSAEAAWIRAQKTGATHDDTKNLRTLVTNLNSQIDNKMNTMNSKAHELASWKLQKQQANAIAGKDPGAPNPEFDAKIDAIQKEIDDLETSRNQQMTQADSAIKNLESKVKGGK